MKNIFRIYKRDINKILTNWVALLMIVVLMIVPSFYSLFNIAASWDPYGNTKEIKIAVINEDKGTIFKEQDINLGKELVEKLQDNDKMGWTFVDKETGKNGLLKEKYYATIEIPENFSEDVTTLVDKEVKKPKLIYTVNEKKNAIAPKMTDAGLKSVRGQLDENIIKTVSGVMFRVLNESGVDIQNNRKDFRKIIDNIYELDESMPDIEKLLDTAMDGTDQLSDLLNKVNEIIPTVSDTIDSTDDFLVNSKEFLDMTQSGLSDISPIVKEDLVMSENLLDTTGIQLRNLDENVLPEVAKKTLIMVSDTSKATKESIDDVISKLKSIQKFLNKVSKIEIPNAQSDGTSEAVNSLNVTEGIKDQVKSLKNIQKNLRDISETIDGYIDKLDDINEKLDLVVNRVDEEIDRLDNGGKLDTQTLTDLIAVLDDVHSLVADIVDKYDSEIIPTIQFGFDSINQISESGIELLEEGRKTLPEVENLLSSFHEITDFSSSELVNLKDKFPEMKDKIHEIADKLRNMDEEDQVDELLDMITNNWEEQSNFMSSAVEIEDNRLFPWPNYGSTATPFYTVLCLWVGGLLSSALLSLEAPEFEDGTKIKAYEMYIGKLLLFLTIGLFQSIIASTGALFILGSYSVHPIMFVLFCIFVTIVFIVIIYTTASVLGDVGKAIIVVILVLQMAGSGGNFPIQVAPEFYQIIYPYLPFTYAINGVRQIMAGIVYPILLKDIAILSIYMIVFLIIGVLFKNIINKPVNKIEEKLASSGILRH